MRKPSLMLLLALAATAGVAQAGTQTSTIIGAAAGGAVGAAVGHELGDRNGAIIGAAVGAAGGAAIGHDWNRPRRTERVVYVRKDHGKHKGWKKHHPD